MCRLLFLWFLCSPFGLFSQNEAKEEFGGSFALVPLKYGIGRPGGDLQNRFGSHFELGTGVAFLGKRNLYIGLQYGFIFGNAVKINPLAPLETIEGGLIGRDLSFASVALRQRGQHYALSLGYLFSTRQNARKAGILAHAGVGVLTHKIRIVDDFDAVTPISGLYLRGYDRLSRCLSLHQSVGYLYMSENKMINLYASIDLVEGFTRSLRQYNYDTRQPDRARASGSRGQHRRHARRVPRTLERRPDARRARPRPARALRPRR